MIRLFVSPKEIVEARQTSNLERRCVYDLYRKNPSGDQSERDRLGRAFAICRSSLQKSGAMKPGTARMTRYGSGRSSSKSKLKDNSKKIKGFERMVRAARTG